MTRSYENSLNLVEGDFFGAAVVSRARRGMVRHLRRFFERAAVLQISGDARRPKGMIADLRADASGFGAPLNHFIGIRLGQGIAGELAGRTAEQCGWVKDRYGLSWQIVSRQLTRLLGDADPARAKRAFDAMMQMKRIDIAALERTAKSA
jgi:hypothetical protein